MGWSEVTKEKVRLSLFTNDLFVYVGNSKKSSSRQLLVSEFRKVMKYKVKYKNQLYCIPVANN